MVGCPHYPHYAMEEPTQFNLNETLSRWRDRMAASPALGAGDLEELEAHLRDSIAALEAKGLSAYEASLVARSRLGRVRRWRTSLAK